MGNLLCKSLLASLPTLKFRIDSLSEICWRVRLRGTLHEAKTWKFDAKNELGIYIGIPSGAKRSSLVYWPQSQTISERMHCWKLDMCDTQFMQYYRHREEMRGGAMPLVEVLEHTTDFRIVEPVPGRGASDSPSVRPVPEGGSLGNLSSS